MAFIDPIPEGEATGLLARIYAAARERAGRVFQILRVQSRNPATLQASLALYQASMFGESDVTRAEREMIAVVVSHANDCFY
ncbi:MAG: carboxymuconolactone decarboxylase family protein [Planctomycetota bacterium JB042]